MTDLDMVKRYRTDEMDRLMAQVQELMEVSVLAMIVRHPSGQVAIAVPPYQRDEVLAILRSYDWGSLT